MSKLNKIFFGPAGTGKTRQAITEAIKIVKSKSLKLQNDNGDYNKIINIFNQTIYIQHKL